MPRSSPDPDRHLRSRSFQKELDRLKKDVQDRAGERKTGSRKAAQKSSGTNAKPAPTTNKFRRGRSRRLLVQTSNTYRSEARFRTSLPTLDRAGSACEPAPLSFLGLSVRIQPLPMGEAILSAILHPNLDVKLLGNLGISR